MTDTASKRLATLIKAAPFIPAPIAQAATAQAFALLMEQHPNLFDRLGDYKESRFLFDVTDLPWVVLLSPSAATPIQLASKDHPAPNANATIRATLHIFIGLLQGDLDGDALFFDRTLSVEGETPAFVALRNTLEAADIDLREDLLDALGPFRPEAETAISIGDNLLSFAERHGSSLLEAIAAPVTGLMSDFNERLTDLEAKQPKTGKNASDKESAP